MEEICSEMFTIFNLKILRENMYLFDIIGDNIQYHSNSQWMKTAKLISIYVVQKNQTIVFTTGPI